MEEQSAEKSRWPFSQVELPVVFSGFTNTNHNMMYIEHSANSPTSQFEIAVPVIINVQKEELRKQLKIMPRGTKMTIVITRSSDRNGLCAILEEIVNQEPLL